MLYKIDGEDGRVVAWERLFPPDGPNDSDLAKSRALEYLAAGMEVVELYVDEYLMKLAGEHGTSYRVPSLLVKLDERMTQLQGHPHLPGEFTAWLEKAVIGLANIVTLMMGEVRLSMLAHIGLHEWAVPLGLGEDDPISFPSKVLEEIRAYQDALAGAGSE